MTKRIIEINIDSPLGNKLYWFLKLIMEKYPDEIKEREQ